MSLAASRPRAGRCVAALAAGLTAAITTAVTPAALAQDLPDDWFFSGADRPAALKALEGKPAPEIAIDTWIGEELALEDLRGDVVIVDFWATWCGPCMAAIPKNIELVKDHADEGLHLIGVHDSRNGWDSADQVVRDTGINYSVGRDDAGASVAAYSVSFWPTYVAVDRRGIVRGAGLRPDKLAEVVAMLLAEAPPPGTRAGGGGGADAAAAAPEFPADWYVGGIHSDRLLALEGEPAPAIEAAEWSGGAAPADAALRGRVQVVHFLAPWSRRSRELLPALARQAADLRQQGVVVIGVSDHEAPLEATAALLAGGPGAADTFLLARDAAPAEDARLPLGRTAAAYGVRMWPMSVLIDRAGRVRAAGIRPERIPEAVARLMAERLEVPAPDAADAAPGAATATPAR